MRPPPRRRPLRRCSHHAAAVRRACDGDGGDGTTPHWWVGRIDKVHASSARRIDADIVWFGVGTTQKSSLVLTALELRSAPANRLFNMLGREAPDDVTPAAAPPRQ